MQLQSSERSECLISQRTEEPEKNLASQGKRVHGHSAAMHGSLERDSVLNHLEAQRFCDVCPLKITALSWEDGSVNKMLALQA